MGLWYTANGFGIAIGGLLGTGIGHIKGSLPSWKYEFLIIGALCCIWGIVMFIMLPDSPLTAKGMNMHEKRMTVERLRENQTGVENKHFKAYQVWEALKDYKLYLFYALGVVGNVPNGGISNFVGFLVEKLSLNFVTDSRRAPLSFKASASLQSEQHFYRYHMAS